MLLDFRDLRSTLPLDRGYSGATSLLEGLQRIFLCGYNLSGTRINGIRSSLSLLSIVLCRILRTVYGTVHLYSPVLSQGSIRTSGIGVLLSSVSSLLRSSLCRLSRSDVCRSSFYGINNGLNLTRFDKISNRLNRLNVICNGLDYTASNSGGRSTTRSIKISVVLTTGYVFTTNNIVCNDINAVDIISGSVNISDIIRNDLDLIRYGNNIANGSLKLFLDILGSICISLSLIGIVLGGIVLAIDKTIHLNSPVLSQLNGLLSILYTLVNSLYSLILSTSNGTYGRTSGTINVRLSLFYSGINLSFTRLDSTADITSSTIDALLDLFLKSTQSILSLLSSLLSSLYSLSHIGLSLRPSLLDISIGLLKLIRNGLCSIKDTLSILESLLSLLCGLSCTLGILQVLTIGNHIIGISSPTSIGDLIAMHVNIAEHVSKTRTFTVFLSKPEQLLEVLIHSLVGKLSLAVEDILHLIGSRNSSDKNFRSTCYGGRDTNLLSIPYPSIRSSLLSFGSNLNIVYKNM